LVRCTAHFRAKKEGRSPKKRGFFWWDAEQQVGEKACRPINLVTTQVVSLKTANPARKKQRRMSDVKHVQYWPVVRESGVGDTSYRSGEAQLGVGESNGQKKDSDRRKEQNTLELMPDRCLWFSSGE
jgi:hypothetical protein